jgi:predicted MPP superfamily phosphohydrolase
MRRRAAAIAALLGPIVLVVVAALALATLAWGWFEAGWVRFRELHVSVPGLPPELDGLRIAHLSDFHLGTPSRGARAVDRAADWVAGRKPDLTLVTGDLVSRPGGKERLDRVLDRLPSCLAILGNHDLAISRDPFVERALLPELEPATLLSDEGVFVDISGCAVYIAGADPRSRWVRSRKQLPDLAVPRDEADLRILIVHYPRLVDQLPAGAFDLVVAGHTHDGQICLPFPGGKLRLAHLHAPYSRGLYDTPAGVMHVSAGLGTTFVPFRFAARPEATELVLQGVL